MAQLELYLYGHIPLSLHYYFLRTVCYTGQIRYDFGTILFYQYLGIPHATPSINIEQCM